MLSFVPFAEDLYEFQIKDDYDFARVLEIAKHGLESLEFDIYHAWMKVLKAKLQRMIIPAIIESPSRPMSFAKDSGWVLGRFLSAPPVPKFSMDDLLGLLNEIYNVLQGYFIEKSTITQAVTELLKLAGVTSFNDLLLRKNFLSWSRVLQIKHNIGRIEGWCKSHDLPDGILQLEHLLVRMLLCQLRAFLLISFQQATKLSMLQKSTLGDLVIIQDQCWM